MPARKACPTARRSRVLGDENRVATVRRLPAIVAWLCRRQPLRDDVLSVFANSPDTAQVDYGAVSAAQSETCTEVVLSDSLQSLIKLGQVRHLRTSWAQVVD